MEAQVGEIYTRHSDGTVWRVKKIDNIMVVLELEGGPWQSLTPTNIFGLEKAYSKRESKPTQKTPAGPPGT
jgi:hypothetical protein